MDDLYQNAWSETNDTASAFKTNSRSSWSSPSKLTSSFNEEADLAAPSWSTGVGIQWDEPSGSPGFSWSQADADAGWGPSTYEGITLGKPPVEVAQEEIQEEVQEQVSTEATDEAPEDSAETPTEEVNNYVALAASPGNAAFSLPSSPVQPSHDPPALELERAISPVSSKASLSPTLPPPRPVPVVVETYDVAPELVAPPSPDGFGTFESGLADDTSAFTANDTDADPWGASAWADAKQEADEDEPVVDEWERARQQKAKQDRRVVSSSLVLAASGDISS